MSKDDKDADYEVGYGKPPETTRFKKGQSGNPKGRPAGAKGWTEPLAEGNCPFLESSSLPSGFASLVRLINCRIRNLQQRFLNVAIHHFGDKLLHPLPAAFGFKLGQQVLDFAVGERVG